MKQKQQGVLYYCWGLLANHVDQGFSGLVLPALSVVVKELQLDIRQDARAVVDLLDGIAEGAGDGPALPVLYVTRHSGEVPKCHHCPVLLHRLLQATGWHGSCTFPDREGCHKEKKGHQGP